MLLLLAFVAITVGCVVLWLELAEYGEAPWWKTDGVPAVTSQLAPPATPRLASGLEGMTGRVRLAGHPGASCQTVWF